eukprot:scaffold616_cov89-Phaeocystis_antarctica.AAC.3
MHADGRAKARAGLQHSLSAQHCVAEPGPEVSAVVSVQKEVIEEWRALRAHEWRQQFLRVAHHEAVRAHEEGGGGVGGGQLSQGT